MAEGHKRPESKAYILERLRKFVAGYLRAPEIREGEAVPTTIWGLSPFERIGGRLDLGSSNLDEVKKQVKEITEDARNEELLAIARAELKLARESAQKNLVILHRTQVISFAALIVAIFAVVFSH